jgi:MFS family permease
MTGTQPVSSSANVANGSWLPMAVITLAQIQMSFNVTALPVSIGQIVEDFDTSSTAIASALVVYSLCVACFVMLGAKMGKLIGERLVFQVAIIIHGLAMLMVALSGSAKVLNSAQAIAGLAAAAIVPGLVVLIAANYHGRRQAQCLGILAGTPAIASVLAFVVAGALGTTLTWRYSFGLLTMVSAVVLLLSFRIKPIARRSVRIDFVGAVLAALSIGAVCFGFQFLSSWGLLAARDEAPLTLLGLSPAPFLIVAGLLLAQAFFAWTHRRQAGDRAALVSLEVLDSPPERNAAFAMLIIAALSAAVNFLLPLWMQIVQGYTSLQTAYAAVPYTLAVFLAALFVVRLYDWRSVRVLGAAGFLAVAAGLLLLAFTAGAGWGKPAVIAGLVVFGLGEGALLTLLFNVLITASPKRLAGDVGALRGTANNLATAVGTAVAGLVSVGLLGLFLAGGLSARADAAAVPRQLGSDRADFVGNDTLRSRLEDAGTAPEAVDAAVDVNTDARRRALRGTFFFLAAVALLAVIPSLRLPPYTFGEIPVPEEDRDETPLPGLPTAA